MSTSSLYSSLAIAARGYHSVRSWPYQGAMAPSAMLPDDAPAWRRHFHGDGYGYGWLLGLILFTIFFQMAASETEAARVLTIFLQGFTLIAALSVSGVRRWLVHLASVITTVAVLAAIGIVIGSGELDLGGGRA